MLSVSSKIWTRIAVSIAYDDNHYTRGTSQNLLIAILTLPMRLWINKGNQNGTLGNLKTLI